MIFFSANAWRTIFVRIMVVATFVLVVGSSAQFRLSAPTPGVHCNECATNASNRYYSNSVPTKQVALTFDDGPDPVATPRILDVLDKHNVTATFFILGQLAVREPELVKEIHARGHEIGNHSFTHAHSVHQSADHVAWELNMNSKVIESLTGSTPLLYRPPFLLDLDPYEALPPLERDPVWGWVDRAGYMTVGTDLDSFDWQVKDAAGVKANVNALLREKETYPAAARRHIFLFHDLPHTAEALDDILTTLTDRGYEVVPLTDVLGISRASVMPAYESTWQQVWTQLFLNTYQGLRYVLLIAVILITFFSTARFVLFLYAKARLLPKREKGTCSPQAYTGRVTVLVPAYNEAENVRATLLSILANTRVPDEILVINDGSTDDTEAHALSVAAHHPDVVKVVTLENGGKARAQNAGITLSTGDVIVAIDGDTVLDRTCIAEVVAPFADPQIGAVAGKILPAASTTLLEKYQHLEYLVGQNMDKAIISMLGAVNIVPGAIGAWRRDALVRAGGYSTETLVEDQDLTLAILLQGYQVVYAENALAYTEVPTSLRSFYLQRFRWTYGTFQCMWKYRAHLFGTSTMRLGWVALPYAFIMNVALPVVAVFLYFAILLGTVMRVSDPALLALLVFTLLDILYAWVALRTEARAQRALLPHIILQRFVYILIYAYLALLVSLKVLDGSSTKWNKLKRSGSAQRMFLAQQTVATPGLEGVRTSQSENVGPEEVTNVLQGPFGTSFPSTNFQ